MFDFVAKNTLVPLILRLGLAVIFIYHGLDKVYGLDKLSGAEPDTANASKDKGWGTDWAPVTDPEKKMPVILQVAVAWGELLGGIALAIGLLTRVAALGIAALMMGAIITVTGANGFDNLKHGYEYNFAILVMCAAVVLLGGGTLAMDRVFRLRRRSE